MAIQVTKNGFPAIFQMPQESGARNKANAKEVEPTPYYSRDDMPVFRKNPSSGDEESD